MSSFLLSSALVACREAVQPTPTPPPPPAAQAAAKLVFTLQPSNAIAGEVITPAVVVTIEDQFGHSLRATESVTVGSGVPVLGTTTVTAINGVATFRDLSIQRAGGGYNLWVAPSDFSWPGAVSASFTIAPAAPTQLGFIVQPSPTYRTQPITPPVQVAIQDRFGNTVPSATTPVTLSLGTNPGGGTLSGTTTVNAVNGVATFANLSVASLGNGYTLGATASSLPSATSTAFDIVTTAFDAGLTFASVSAGWQHTCGVTPAGAAYCWGLNNFGQLGNGTTANSTALVPVSGGLTFAAVSAGPYYTCGVTTAHTAYCWGQNESGQLGNGTTTNSSTPAPVSGGLSFATVSLAGDIDGNWTCGLSTVGTAYCWGVNYTGELGNGSTSNSATPVAVSGGLTFAAVSAQGAPCGVTSAGAAYCWGYNGGGMLGSGATTGPQTCNGYPCSVTPFAVSGGLTFAAVSPGGQHTCGVTSAGAAYCWGTEWWGALGNGTMSGPAPWCQTHAPCSPAPVPVSGALAFATVSAGSEYTCGVTPAGAAYCWGADGSGQLGNGTYGPQNCPVGFFHSACSTTPAAVVGGLAFAQVSAGGSHTCGVTKAGAVYCWGDNTFGELGDRTAALGGTHPSPRPVSAP